MTEGLQQLTDEVAIVEMELGRQHCFSRPLRHDRIHLHTDRVFRRVNDDPEKHIGTLLSSTYKINFYFKYLLPFLQIIRNFFIFFYEYLNSHNCYTYAHPIKHAPSYYIYDIIQHVFLQNNIYFNLTIKYKKTIQSSVLI